MLLNFDGTMDELLAKLGAFAPEFTRKDATEVIQAATDHNASVQAALEMAQIKWTAKIKANKTDPEMVDLLQGKLESEVARLTGQIVEIPSEADVVASQDKRELTHRTDWAKMVLTESGLAEKTNVKVRTAAGNSDGKFGDKWAVSLKLTKDIEATAVNFRKLSDAQKTKYNLKTSTQWLVKVGNREPVSLDITSPNNLVVGSRLLAGLSTSSPINNSVWNEAANLTQDQSNLL